MSQLVESLDPRIAAILGDPADKLPLLREKVLSQARPGWDPEDSVDISILPRLLPKAHFQEVESACQLLTVAAMGLFSRYLDDPATIPEMRLNQFLQTLPLKQRVVSGNARYDFLKEGDVLRLTELNFVGVGCSGYSSNLHSSLMELYPELHSFARVLNPVLSTKARLQEQGARHVLILTAANDTGMSGLDKRAVRGIFASEEPALEAHIVPEDQYSQIQFRDGAILYDGVPMDAVYPRHMYLLDSLLHNEPFVRQLVASDVFLFDHFKLMFLEDKDLRFLSDVEPRVTPYLARTTDVRPVPNPQDYVIKVRDAHAGEGVSLAQHDSKQQNAIMQERIHINRFPVHTLRGGTGHATFETSFYVSYRYNLDTRTLEHCGVSGCLTRASYGELITGQRIILIPVLIER